MRFMILILEDFGPEFTPELREQEVRVRADLESSHNAAVPESTYPLNASACRG